MLLCGKGQGNLEELPRINASAQGSADVGDADGAESCPAPVPGQDASGLGTPRQSPGAPGGAAVGLGLCCAPSPEPQTPGTPQGRCEPSQHVESSVWHCMELVLLVCSHRECKSWWICFPG